MGDEFDIPHRFDGYARMLESVDAVYIGTPHATHFDLAHQALERGRHVLCEKPRWKAVDCVAIVFLVSLVGFRKGWSGGSRGFERDGVDAGGGDGV
ncbi:Gfo/Idh/MocA family oxidoreductase, partial [Arthrobacter sp. NQ7]|uniref:Gfo/Idh/MocA family oxidoreductase n=1 Tax=Arthrobacter sp. NQ7 TaxID=3032303 RepID=UPI0024104083